LLKLGFGSQQISRMEEFIGGERMQEVVVVAVVLIVVEMVEMMLMVMG